MVYEQFFRLRLFPSDALNIVYLRTFIALFYLRLSLYWWRYHNLVITHYIHLIAGCITTRRSCRLFSLFKDNLGLQKDYIVVYYIDSECSYQVREPLSFKARTVTCMSKRIMYVQKTFRSLLGGSDGNTVSIPMLSLLKRLNDAYFPGISPVPLR